MFFIQFPILIRILDLISVPNDSRDSFILIKFNTLSSWREIVSVHLSQWFNSLNWIQLNDADDFLQFPILILNLDLISVPNHSKGSYILMKFNIFSSWREIVSVHSSQWCNSLFWIQPNDADVFLQFPILIRILDLISVLNHSKDSIILIIFTLSPHGGILLVSIRVSRVIFLIGYSLMMQIFFIQFPILILNLDLISVPNHSKGSYILIKFNIFSSWREIVSVHSSQLCNSLFWIQPNDADVFLQFPILIRILDLISVLNHSKDSIILIIFTLCPHGGILLVSIRVSRVIHLIGYSLMMQIFFIQFPILIRILDLISVPNHSKGSYILIKFNTFSSRREIVSVHSSQLCNSLNWIYLNDADDFLQFPILIRILGRTSVPKYTRDSFTLIKFNTFSSWREIVSVHSSQWCNSLNWIQLNDADVFHSISDFDSDSRPHFRPE